MSQNFNYYDILGVARDATVDEIKKAYKRAALTHHPDKGGDQEKFKDCGAAVETLTDERKRAAYDANLIRARSKDGLGGGNRDSSGERGRSATSSRPPPQDRRSSAAAGGGSAPSAPPKPPRPPAGAVEIPSEPGSLSIKELKELLSALGINHEGAVEKADLLALLKDRKKGGEGTPRASSSAPSRPAPSPSPPAGAQPAAPRSAGTRALRVKVMSLGSSAVGKSTLIKRYCEGRFVQKYIPTIGIDYGVKPVNFDGHDLKVNFFDTSGGEEFSSIRNEFYTMGQTNGVLLVYDVTNRKSFDDVETWIAEANRMECPISRSHKSGGSSSPPAVVLLANKTDLGKRAVSRADGEDLAYKHGMRYFETSSTTGEGVNESMNYIFQQVVAYHVEIGKKVAMAAG